MNLRFLVGASMFGAVGVFLNIIIFGLADPSQFPVLYFFLSFSSLLVVLYFLKKTLNKPEAAVGMLLAFLFAVSSTYLASNARLLTQSVDSPLQYDVDQLSDSNAYLYTYIAYQMDQLESYRSKSQEIAANLDDGSSRISQLQTDLLLAKKRLDEYQTTIEEYQKALDNVQPVIYYVEREHEDD